MTVCHQLIFSSISDNLSCGTILVTTCPVEKLLKSEILGSSNVKRTNNLILESIKLLSEKL